MHFDSLGINNLDDWKGAEEERFRSLVREFFTAPSVNCIIKRGDMSVVERWLMELGVGWVLSLDDGPSAVEEEELDRDALTWIRALHQIEKTIRSTMPLFRDRGSVPSICMEQGEHVGGICILDRYHFALFMQEALLKMLTFVDIVVAWDPNRTQEFLTMDRVMPLPSNKLVILLGLHGALSSNKILDPFIDWATSVEVKRIVKAMDNLLLAYKSKVGEATWSTMEKIRTKLLEDGGSSSSLNPQGSSDIHKVTMSVMEYISFMRSNSSSMCYIVSKSASLGKCVPQNQIGDGQPLDSVIMETMSCLLEKLVKISESFLDQGLRFLFLLNNLTFI